MSILASVFLGVGTVGGIDVGWVEISVRSLISRWRPPCAWSVLSTRVPSHPTTDSVVLRSLRWRPSGRKRSGVIKKWSHSFVNATSSSRQRDPNHLLMSEAFLRNILKALILGKIPYTMMWLTFAWIGESLVSNCLKFPFFLDDCTSFVPACNTFSLPLSAQSHRVRCFLQVSILTGKLWNDLPLSVFPFAYDLNSFKRSVRIFILLKWPLFRTTLFSFTGAGSSGLFFFLLSRALELFPAM